MKVYRVKKMLALSFFMIFGLAIINAQAKKTNVSSEISYKVIMGVGLVSQIEGESNFLNGEIEVNDETNELKSVNFTVPVNSFNGFHSDYLAWVGGFGNPNLKFVGKSVEKIDEDNYRVYGSMYFRNSSQPMQIRLRKKSSSNQFILAGNFNLRARDYFIGRYVSRQVVPTWIPFEVTLVFDNFIV